MLCAFWFAWQNRKVRLRQHKIISAVVRSALVLFCIHLTDSRDQVLVDVGRIAENKQRFSGDKSTLLPSVVLVSNRSYSADTPGGDLLEEATVSVKLQSPTDPGNGIMENALYSVHHSPWCHGSMPWCLPSNDLPFLPRLPFHLFSSAPLGPRWVSLREKLKPTCDISIVAHMLHWATAQLAVLFIILGWLDVVPAGQVHFCCIFVWFRCKAAVALAPSNIW
jgi:hypothetical protein